MTDSLYKQIGRRLRQAREEARLSQEQLARLLAYNSPATISLYEAGERKIAISDLQRIARTLKRPLEYFLDEQDQSDHLHHFRLRAKEVNPSGRESVAEFLSYVEGRGSRAIETVVAYSMLVPSHAAKRLLADAEIYEPPVDPHKVSEYLGVPVIEWYFPDEISGIFVSTKGNLCVGVNKLHHPVRQHFTLAHECGHLIYNEDEDLHVDYSSVDLSAWAVNTKNHRIERKANQFAAYLLMPEAWLRRDVELQGLDPTELARRYGVSEQAMWIQLTNFRLV